MKTKKTIATLLTVLITTTACVLPNALNAQTEVKSMKECCMMKDGKMMHYKNGKTVPMKMNKTMANGTKCMTNGECVMKNGDKMMMKDGDCMDMKGNVNKCETMQKTSQSDKVTSTKYACSMHPEVTSDKPGKCSKCGMDLSKK